MDAGITEICQKVKITDYLESRGVTLTRTRKGAKCCCPFPDHKDDTPSFNITTSPRDGAEIYKCFGSCGRAGNIITLIAELEKQKKGSVIRRLSTQAGVTLGHYSPDEKTEPPNDEILGVFCEEDKLSRRISALALAFLTRYPGNDDAVNKVSRIYQRLDYLIEEGNFDEIKKLGVKLKKIVRDYDFSQAWGDGIPKKEKEKENDHERP